jgi:hypothetical protein
MGFKWIRRVPEKVAGSTAREQMMAGVSFFGEQNHPSFDEFL